jgi:hypothetical protein
MRSTRDVLLAEMADVIDESRKLVEEIHEAGPPWLTEAEWAESRAAHEVERTDRRLR